MLESIVRADKHNIVTREEILGSVRIPPIATLWRWQGRGLVDRKRTIPEILAVEAERPIEMDCRKALAEIRLPNAF